MIAKRLVAGILSIGGVASAVALYQALFATPTPTGPWFLNARAATGGDWTRVCFQDVKFSRRGDEPPGSDFNLWLETRYPIGSPEARLRSDLREAGFVDNNACAGQSEVRAATFRREGRLLEFGLVATVYWATDESERLTWLKGYIFYIGL